MNYREVTQGLPPEVIAKWAEGISAVEKLVSDLQRKGKLPTKFPNPGARQPLSRTPEAVSSVVRDKELRDSLRPFVAKYKSAGIHTPGLIDDTWGNMWKVIGEAVNFAYKVPHCDRSPGELAELKVQNRAALLLPDDIYTPEGLVRLGKAFPLMRSRITEPSQAGNILHKWDTGGCIDIEMSPNAPYRGYTQEELLVATNKAGGRYGQRLPTYLIGSQFSKILTEHYFDEKTGSRLLGSSLKGIMLASGGFFNDGRMSIDNGWLVDGRNPSLGGRTEGVKKAIGLVNPY